MISREHFGRSVGSIRPIDGHDLNQLLPVLKNVRDAGEALSQVQGEARANIVFLMNPCRAAQVRDVAFAGEVMPQKSTDFYPKLLSGLTIYALD